MKRNVAIVLFILLFVFLAHSLIIAESKTLVITGNHFIALDRNTQLFYVIGLLDGLIIQEGFITSIRKDLSGMASFYRSVWTGMEYGQIVDVLLKYIKDNPDERHYPMSYIFKKATFKIVNKRTTKELQISK
jgi:hypothetical protein